MKKDREKFLCAIYILIRNDKNEVLLQRRQGTKLWPGFLALPAGHVDEGENVYEAFVREAKEELGIEVSKNDIINTFVTNRKNKSLSSYFDVYFEINNEKYVIEMDGAQHYGLSNGSSWIAYKTNQKMTKRRIY